MVSTAGSLYLRTTLGDYRILLENIAYFGNDVSAHHYMQVALVSHRAGDTCE